MNFAKPGDFGRRLRDWRLAKGLSQAQLGEKMHLSRNYIAGVEHNVIPSPDYHRCIEISKALDIDLQVVWGASASEHIGRLDIHVHEWLESLGQDVPRNGDIEQLESDIAYLRGKLIEASNYLSEIKGITLQWQPRAPRVRE